MFATRVCSYMRVCSYTHAILFGSLFTDECLPRTYVLTRVLYCLGVCSQMSVCHAHMFLHACYIVECFPRVYVLIHVLYCLGAQMSVCHACMFLYTCYIVWVFNCVWALQVNVYHARMFLHACLFRVIITAIDSMTGSQTA